MKILGLIRTTGTAALTAAALVTLAFAATVGQAASGLPSITWSPVTSPGTFDYGAVVVGQAISQTFALTNSGRSATGALSVSLEGATEFTITADACTGTALGPGKSCNVTVQYAPTADGQNTATFAANGQRPSASASITLKGTGTAQPSLVMTDTQASCGGPTCWGFVSGSGLAPGAAVHIFAATPFNGEFATGVADSNGNFNAGPLMTCGFNWTGVHATSTTAGNQPITSNTVNTPCN